MDARIYVCMCECTCARWSVGPLGECLVHRCVLPGLVVLLLSRLRPQLISSGGACRGWPWRVCGMCWLSLCVCLCVYVLCVDRLAGTGSDTSGAVCAGLYSTRRLLSREQRVGIACMSCAGLAGSGSAVQCSDVGWRERAVADICFVCCELARRCRYHSYGSSSVVHCCRQCCVSS